MVLFQGGAIIQKKIKEDILFPGLKSETKEKLLQWGRMKSYGKKEIIFLDRQNEEKIYILLEGYAALYKVNKNMERKIIFILGPGDILNEEVLENTIVSTNSIALEETKLLLFTKKQWLELMEQDFSLVTWTYNEMAMKIRRLCHQLGNTTNAMRLNQQVAAKLWKLAKDYGIRTEVGIQIPFDMTISFLADMVGSKRETVSRVIKNYAQQGLVSMRQNRCIIYNMERLKKITMEYIAASYE